MLLKKATRLAIATNTMNTILKVTVLSFIIFITFCHCLALSYHGSGSQRGHKDDFEAVLPFVWNDKLDEWGKSVTDNLDRFTNNNVPEYGGLSTYHYFAKRFGVTCNVGDHRAFFHWGYQRYPWSDEILKHLPDSIKNDSIKLDTFKKALVFEQKRRNRITNAETEKILGFGTSGRQARYANAFITIIYDVHILGDYETTSIDGLAAVSAIVAELNTAIRNIDQTHASSLTKELQRAEKSQTEEKAKALDVLNVLRQRLPSFIASADDGNVNMREHFEKLGYQFKPELSQNKNADKSRPTKLEANGNKDMIVAVTHSGKKYHKTNCGNLKKAKNPSFMTIDEAIRKGNRAALCCFPLSK